MPVQLAQATAVLAVDGVALLILEAPDQSIPLAPSNETAALVACLERAADGVTALPMIQLCIVTGLLSHDLGALSLKLRGLYEGLRRAGP